MKVIAVVGFLLVFGSGAFAQRRAGAPATPFARPSGFPVASPPPGVVPSAGALGGSFASVGISRPLGGIAPPFPSPSGTRRHSRPDSGSRYIGPVYYVPGVYDTSFYQPSSYSIFNQPANPALFPPPAGAMAPPSQPPVIIHQYFGYPPPHPPNEEGNGGAAPEPGAAGNSTGTRPGNAPAGGLLGMPRNYYLIAYRDHSVYSALAYWLEGDTLHYVTTDNTHNQASLALIDLDRTARLNADNSVPFSLPGR